jgi:hypothetical protein
LGPEQSVYIHASLFDWQDSESILIPWVEEGGSLLISLESGWYNEDDDFAPQSMPLTQFLEAIGVQAEICVYEDDEDDGVTEDNYEENDDDVEPQPGSEVALGQRSSVPLLTEDAEPESTVILSSTILADIDPLLAFDSRFCFSLIEDFDFAGVPLTMEDEREITRLVSVPLGQGSVTVTGQPYFMYNDNLESEENARLAWELTAAKTKGENQGVLFIRGRRTVKSLFGKLAERGNLLPPLVSVLALVCIGFWMVIPGFGVVRSGDERRARPIRDRFRAEARFLKKYHALDGYLEVYLREIKSKCRDREKDPRIAEIENSLVEKKHRTYGEIIRDLKILETTMEHL